MAAVTGGSGWGTTFRDASFLICRVCEGAFRGPKLLPCLHSFCGDCLESSLAQGQIEPGQAFLCPLCRTRCSVPAKGVRDMTGNCLVSSLLEFLRSKTVPEPSLNGEEEDVECGGCHKADVARKCIECADWLCNRCCAMHAKVKVTKDHHLVTGKELESGEYDAMIKDCLESSLLCGKHGEPFKYFCEEESCQIPICHLCKMTLGHDNHSTATIAEQAAYEARRIKDLLPNVDRFIRTTEAKLENLNQEEKITAFVRKRMHKEILERTEQVIEKLLKTVEEFAEELHQSVEGTVQDHRDEITRESDEAKSRLEGARTAKAFAETLIRFDRPEELITLTDQVCSRLAEFQTPSDPAPPSWKKPRLDAGDEIDRRMAEKHFGNLRFEKDVVKSVMAKTFSARLNWDESACKLCDMSLDGDGNIVVVDRDNRSVKMFDADGALKMSTRKKTFQAPNRIAVLRKSRRILVKDEKFLRLMSFKGEQVGTLTDQMKQPVAITESEDGEVIVTEWMSGEVIVLDETGKKIRSFPCSCEAPGYVASSPNGNIILTDWKRHVVKIFDRRGRLRKEYGEYGSGDGQLDHPYGVCADQSNNIIVCDTWNNRIHLLSPEGDFVRTLLTKAEGLEWPQAVAVDKTGQLVIAEQRGTIKFYRYMT